MAASIGKTVWLEINPDSFKQDDLKPAVRALKRGGVIAYPTETVYGLGANIFHQKSIQKVFSVKRRDPHKPISAMIASVQDVDELCTEIPDYARELMDIYWPGPLTLIMEASENVPRYMTSPERKIGLRLPDHPITKALMVHHRQPITSTSANITGAPPPIGADEVDMNIQSKIELVVNAGRCLVQVPSTVIDCSGAKPKLLRNGAIVFSEIIKKLQGVH